MSDDDDDEDDYTTRYICDLTRTGFTLRAVDDDDESWGHEVTVDCNITPQDVAVALKELLNDKPAEVLIMSNMVSEWHGLADALFNTISTITAVSFTRSTRYVVGVLVSFGKGWDGVVLDARNENFIATTICDGMIMTISENGDAVRALEGCSTRVFILSSAASAVDSVREAMPSLSIVVSDETARSLTASAAQLRTCNDWQQWFYRGGKREWESMKFEEGMVIIKRTHNDSK
mgnify:CR=1 FL=1